MNRLRNRGLSFGLTIILAFICAVPAASAAAPGAYFTLRGLNRDTGEEELWIDEKAVEITGSGATAADVILESLEAEGYSQTGADGGYIKSVTAPDGFVLSEMHGGMPYSGWLFKVNSLMPEVGMDALAVNDGDHILLYFTKDFMVDFSIATDEPFADVNPDDWYYEYVKTVYERGLMLGTGEGCFTPGGVLTRAMLATILYRLAGEPPVTSENPFIDVENGVWYANAAVWLNGYGEFTAGAKFNPDGEATYGLLVQTISDYLEREGYGAAFTGGAPADKGGLPDNPDSVATRAQAAAVFSYIFEIL